MRIEAQITMKKGMELRRGLMGHMTTVMSSIRQMGTWIGELCSLVTLSRGMYRLRGDFYFDDDVKIMTHEMSSFYSNEDSRLALALLTIDTLMQFHFFCNNQSYYSLKLLYRTITDAYLTQDEMARVLQVMLEIHADRGELFRKFCGTYELWFPQGLEPLQPRSLKHLCRVQVRHAMIRANSIHFGIPDLPVPKALKNYLLLEE